MLPTVAFYFTSINLYKQNGILIIDIEIYLHLKIKKLQTREPQKNK